MTAGTIEVKACPVCGGEERDDIDGMSPKKTAGYHYLKHAADALQLSVSELVEVINVYRCSKCGSFYCDPWLSPELSSQVFCSGAPDHIAGWGTLPTDYIYTLISKPTRQGESDGCLY